MAYASSTTYLFTRRHLVPVSQRGNDQMQFYMLYDFNGRQIEIFHMKWFNDG